MDPTITLMMVDFFKKLPALIEQGELLGITSAWNGINAAVHAHLGVFFVYLFISFLFSLIMALLGNWSLLGSFLYNMLYFGILYLLGSIFGPRIFVSNLFEPFCIALLHPLCFKVVGKILAWTGLRKQAYR